MESVGNDYLCRRLTRLIAPIAALWSGVVWGAQDEPAWMARTPEIKFEKRASYAEASLQQSVATMFGYSLAVTAASDGRPEVYGGPLVRPLKGVEIGLERDWERAATSRDASSARGDPQQPGAEFDHRGTYARTEPLPVSLGHSGPLKYELHGSRLRVKYYISEHTVLSVRARYNRVEQRASVWLRLETRF